MATITFPFAPSGVTFSANTFDTIAWTPSDALVGTGSQTETAGNHGNVINIAPSNPPIDLSTLGSHAGNITAAIVTYAWNGTYSTVGPGSLYTVTWFDDTHTQAEGASWSHGSTFDATAFFTDGITFFTDLVDLPTWPSYGALFGAGGATIENGVTVGLSITVLSIEFTYTPSSPVVSSLAPTHGDAAGGTVVTISGTNFTGATAVTFNGATAIPNVLSDTELTCVTPEHAVGLVTVTVT